MNEKIFIGINKDGYLIEAKLNYNDLNKGTKWYNPHYRISLNGYDNIIDEETGEREARERLEDSEYWEEIGYLNKEIPSVLANNIDFKAVAEELINSDGWEMTNGEYYEIGDYENKTYYIDVSFCGYEEENSKLNKYNKLFISKEDFKFLFSCKEIKENDAEKVNKIKEIFNKKQDETEIIKSFLEEVKNEI